MWKYDNSIGILYNPIKKSLSYFYNKKYYGTPFENVQGDLKICLEVKGID